MGGLTESVRGAREFAELQRDPKFRSWLLSQEAAMKTGFSVFGVPSLSGIEFTRDGLAVVEREVLVRFSGSNLFSEENYELIDLFVYFVGETFCRNLEGAWVAIPSDSPRGSIAVVVDTEFKSTFFNPRHQIGFVLQRRTGREITRIYDRAVSRYAHWVDLGRPARGTWSGYI